MTIEQNVDSVSARRLDGDGFEDPKSCTYCLYVICVTLIVWAGGMPWPQTGATQYHAQLRFPDKGLVVCNNWDVEPLDMLNGLALGCYQPLRYFTTYFELIDFFCPRI